MKAKEFVRQLLTEAKSNPRLCIVQLFGSDSGFVVSHAALASGQCSAALIPEVDFSLDDLFDNHIAPSLETKLRDDGSPYGIVLVAENAIPVDVEKYIDLEYVGLDKKEKAAIRKFQSQGRRVHGQTPDELRSGGLKVISKVLAEKIKSMPDRYWNDFRVFTNGSQFSGHHFRAEAGHPCC